MLEVFEDQAPLAARQLLNRCREGMRETLHNTHVHRLITDQGMFFGKSHGYVIPRNNHTGVMYRLARVLLSLEAPYPAAPSGMRH